MSSRSVRSRPWFVIAVATLLVAAIVWLLSRDQREVREVPPAPAQSPVARSTVGATATPAPASSTASIRASTPSPVPGVSKTFETFQRRPFAVARTSGMHEWTAEDGRDPDAILDLAHNELEVQRLMEENARIERRQLVYRNETVPTLLERARNTGQPLRSFTLPGLDGKEVEVEVTEIHEEPSLHGGSVTGRVKGRFNSMVSVGFANGYESFNVLSPEDGVFLTADAREPGEVIVKEIDPDNYAPPTGDGPDFILTSQAPRKTRHP